MKNGFYVLERVFVQQESTTPKLDENGLPVTDKKGNTVNEKSLTPTSEFTLRHHSNKLFKNKDGSPREFATPLHVHEAINDARVLASDQKLLIAATEAAISGDQERALELMARASSKITGEIIIQQIIEL